MGDAECPKCHGSTWVLADDGEAIACDCRERTLKRARAAGLFTHIPKRFDGVRFDEASGSFLDRERRLSISPDITRFIRRYVRDLRTNLEGGRGLWLEGDHGTGKTSIAMYVCRKAIEQDFTVAIYSVPHLLMEIRDTFESDSTRSKMKLFNALASVDLLHLDDLGAEKQTEWVIEQLYSIVNERYENELPISVTTNFESQDLIEQIGARTVSRLSQICGDPLPLFGSDRRIAPYDDLDSEPIVRRTIAD